MSSLTSRLKQACEIPGVIEGAIGFILIPLLQRDLVLNKKKSALFVKFVKLFISLYKIYFKKSHKDTGIDLF